MPDNAQHKKKLQWWNALRKMSPRDQFKLLKLALAKR